MKISGDNVAFRSVHPFFSYELYGDKANTVRLVPAETTHRLCHAKTITITSPNGETFTRKLTNVCNVTNVMEQQGVVFPPSLRMLCFSWQHEEVGT